MTQPQVLQNQSFGLSQMAALEACTLAAERREDAALRPLAALSHHVDAMEALADDEFFSIVNGSPQALSNLLARLRRLEQTIEIAARK